MKKNQTHVIDHRLAEVPHRIRRLGRHIVHDPLSLNFPAKKSREIKSVNHESCHDLPLDQGSVGSCTANAALGAMLTEPYYSHVKKLITPDENFAVTLYHEETLLHPRDGVFPPEDPGGCGLWIAKVLKNRGLIKSYSHAFGLNHALRALVLRPCIFGTDWYSSFDDVDENTGLVEIKPHARNEGGHEYVAIGIDAKKKLVWFWQSWGAWGFQQTGRFCMTWDTLDRLLKNQGDCTQFVM